MEIIMHKGDLPANVKFGDSVAVDTETTGLNPVRDRLCLVQLSAGDGIVHLVQLRDDYEAPNLKKLFTDEKVTKIFHFARADVAFIYSWLGVVVYPIYCTKIASKVARSFAPSHSLKNLCNDLLGIELDKEQQTTYWGADELSDKQKVYAATDVLYLHKLRDKLNEILAREARTDFIDPCFQFLPHRAIMDVEGWSDLDIFAH